MAASSSGSMIVPVGLAGLATMSPAGGSGSSSSIATVGWNRVSSTQSSSTTRQPNAANVFRYAGYPGLAMTTVSPASNAARNNNVNAPDDPVVITTSSASTVMPYRVL